MTDTYDGEHRPPPVIPGNGAGYQRSPDFSGGRGRQQPPEPKKSRIWILWLSIAVLVLAVLCGGVVAVFGGSNSNEPKPQKSVSVAMTINRW